ncbi:Ppx/GppA phosphatase family protein [Luteibaculum oceani]|uniref:Exopolyphosphatase n=1 Tax=Luteibaculum oceani TaxID=1294296 RepID=A0A5C6VDA9_9FLAO|nr:exopolyphosphatase [Luteibaculum oceani]TXC81605.1 exopolyphosphatase [Luteibaculum oceani]
MKYGAIDIGSNAMRLLIAEARKKGGKTTIKKLQLVRVPVRLGEEVFEQGKISEYNAVRLAKSINAFKLLMQVYGIKNYWTCATSAMREAENQKQIVDLVHSLTDVEIEVISGAREAKLIQSTFETQNLDLSKKYLYIDVGGGSTEISVLHDGVAVANKSFKIGTVRILKGKVKNKVWEEIAEFAEEQKNGEDDLIAIGTGGNINKLVKLAPNSNTRSREITTEDISNLVSELEPMSVEERMDVFDLKEDRADVIVPAGKIYKTVLENAGLGKIVVPKIGLSDGMVYYMSKFKKYQ